jgi:recombination protein RecA
MANTTDAVDDFTSDLIKSLNREAGSKVAFNLAEDQSPTHVKRWISSGSRQLDWIIANQVNGGYPEGRIVEIFGDPGIGKSHIAAQICRSAQKMGGLAVYIDTENATSPENLEQLGVQIDRQFVYVSEHCTESVLSYAEKTMIKARALMGSGKDIPVVIIWDSVAATSPKAELLGEYADQSIGLQARTISKGMRKITGVVGDNNVLFVCLNQTRTKIGVLYGDPTTTSGGKAIPFHSSVRVQLFGGNHIKNEYGEIVGIHVKAKTIKNKVAMPFRRVEFEIHFGYGIKESEQIFELMKEYGPTLIGDKIVGLGNFHGDGHRKMIVLPTAGGEFSLDDFEFNKKKNRFKWPTKGNFQKKGMQAGALIHRSFYLKAFEELLEDPEVKDYLDAFLAKIMTRTHKKRFDKDSDINTESYVEMAALAAEIEEGLGDLSDME